MKRIFMYLSAILIVLFASCSKGSVDSLPTPTPGIGGDASENDPENEFTLAMFDGSFVPGVDTNTWVITDINATTEQFEGLRNAINGLSGSDRRIFLEFPNLDTLASRAFFMCKDVLRSVSFPVATRIGKEAFQSCGALRYVSFPMVTTIEMNAFFSCRGLRSVSFPAVTTIGETAFQFCDKLNSVSFPLVKTIKKRAFRNCSNLLSASFPNVITIENGVLSDCVNLHSASFPMTTMITEKAFSGCYKLETVSFPIATVIGRGAFASCKSLSDVSFPVVKKIDGYAFSGCVSLTKIALPAVTELKYNIFSSCYILTSIELATNKDVKIKSLGAEMFKLPEGLSQEDKITLTIGSANSENIKGNTLTGSGLSVVHLDVVVPTSYTFKEIIVKIP